MLKQFLLLLFFLTLPLFASSKATYVGDKACVSCHDKEVKAWKGSDHDLAMKEATAESVVGDFNNASMTLHGVTSSFYKRKGKFYIKTDGEDNQLHEYEVAYTFGAYPLQQYLLKFPNGKYQVPDIAWDARKKEEGGQRWYHIHKDEVIRAGDVLHWSGPNLNWNYMCADCHSTNLKKNYDAKSKSYHTTWDVINVSCEACHGPASEHMAWSKNPSKAVDHKGFARSFSKKKWMRGRSIKEDKARATHQELEVCAKCHSRRTQLDDDYTPGDKFADHYLPVLLEEDLYFPDGKIEDEVYVYNSFLQSKMYAEGVTCSDCHDPHTLKRKAAGDKVCFQCHNDEKYTASSHHNHKVGSSGSSCISCHMPARTYMGVDSRNDHSFRVPRPDVSVEMKEVPNACNLCHTDKDAQWSSDAMKKWYGKVPVGKQDFSHALISLRANDRGAPKDLYSILMSSAPTIAKATAVSYLGNYPSKQTYTTTLQMLNRPDAMTRRAALQSLEAFPMKMRIKQTFKMLHDPVKSVRMEAARQLASFPLSKLDETTKKVLLKAFKEYEDVLLFTAERPESQVALAIFYTNRKLPKKAEVAYEEAITLQSQYVPAYINYSDFLMQEGKTKEAKDVLEKGMKAVPNMAIFYHALGLWYVRNNENEKALSLLKKASEIDAGNARFTYVYAVSIGEKSPKEAIKILEKAYTNHRGDLEIVSALVYYYKQMGDVEKSETYEKTLKNLQNF